MGAENLAEETFLTGLGSFCYRGKKYSLMTVELGSQDGQHSDKAMAWMVWGSIPSRCKGSFSSTQRDHLWGPPSLLLSEY